MKIVALEIMNVGPDVDLSEFDDLGDFTAYDITKPEQIEERSRDAEVLIVNKLPINGSTISGLKDLKLICVTATGYDNIDIGYCNSRGIKVCNAVGYSTSSVVQHTFASLFYIYEKLRYYDDYVRNRHYCDCAIFTHFDEYFNELEGKIWGIAGLGNIGRRVAAVAEAFGCRVVYYSTGGKHDDDKYKRLSWDEFLKASDIISIHAPLNDNTRNLFSDEAFDKMKDTAYLVNMGRGPIVDEEALVRAIKSGKIAGAALDVIDGEPMRKDSPLIILSEYPNVLVTPHIAWATVEARTRLMHEVYLNIRAYMNGEERYVIKK
ncbi:MAG: D-2-hydroxyacid dehydrogenase [Lachnospiraceae bacterium]|nr:D-2-hydroxyacid dehydrogenase [Lachnospiraceae bacterium]